MATIDFTAVLRHPHGYELKEGLPQINRDHMGDAEWLAAAKVERALPAAIADYLRGRLDARDGDVATVILWLRQQAVLPVTLTLGFVAVNALCGAAQQAKPSAAEQMHRYTLAATIATAERSGTPVKLTAEDIALLKARIAETYAVASVVGQALMLLDPDAGQPARPAKAA